MLNLRVDHLGKSANPLDRLFRSPAACSTLQRSIWLSSGKDMAIVECCSAVSTWVVLGACELGRLGRDWDNGVGIVHYVIYDVTGVIGRAANDVIAAHAWN